MKKNLNALYLLCLFIVTLQLANGQTVPTGFFGVNGWMSDNVGTTGDPGPNLTPPIAIAPGGDLYTIMGFPGNTNPGNIVETAGFKFLRYGGTSNDVNFPSFDPTGVTDMQFERFVKAARSIGAEPIVQVPFLWQWLQMSSSSTAGQAAANTTYQSKVTALVTRLKAAPFNVKYWSIGNEPDFYHNTHFNRNSNVALQAADIKAYYSVLAPLIKNVDPNALIVGPDLAESWAYWPVANQIGLAYNLIVGQDNILSYVDIWSYHIYPHNGGQSRPTVIESPINTFNAHLTNLRDYISASSKPNLAIAITEFNVTHDNNGPPPGNSAPNGVGDQNCNSFLAGQWMAEMFAVGLINPINQPKVIQMLPWSVHELSGSAGEGDLGLLHGSSHVPRSTYIHTQWMAKNFSAGEQFAMGESNGDGNIKAFSSKRECNKISVVLMNQHTSSKTINVSFNNTYPSSGER